MNQRSNVAYPARGQLNRENEHSPVPPFSFYTKEFGPARRVRPSRPASGRSFSTLRLNLIGWCLLTGFPIPPPPPPPQPPDRNRLAFALKSITHLQHRTLRVVTGFPAGAAHAASGVLGSFQSPWLSKRLKLSTVTTSVTSVLCSNIVPQASIRTRYSVMIPVFTVCVEPQAS